MSTYTDTWTDGHGTVQYFTRSDGSRLRYFTAGSRPALVLMHTIRTQLDYFHRVIPQLWDSFTVYALDLPGMGWSDVVPGARHEEPDLRGAVAEFVTGLHLHDVTLAGNRSAARWRSRPRSTSRRGSAASSRSTPMTIRAASSVATCSPGSSSALSACRAWARSSP
jgi:pimeloyl-ACP methyl ester carboxylesterase